jgi:hypothetical protein
MGERDNLIRPDLQEKPRIPDQDVKHSRTYDPSRYISIQERVNNDPDFEREYVLKLINDGWVRIADLESMLDPTLKGRHFKYRLNGESLSGATKGTFRSGGMIIGMKENDRNYILYKAYNGCIFPLQLSDLKEVYIKDPKKQSIKFNIPKKVTKYPVYLPNPLTKEEVVVFYAENKEHMEQFIKSPEYKKAKREEKWEFEKLNSENIKIVHFNKPTEVTNYPVYLNHPVTKRKTIVYFAKDNNKRDRFMTSTKFNYAYSTNNWNFD